VSPPQTSAQASDYAPPVSDRTGQLTQVVPFLAGDGHPLTLLHVTSSRAVTRGPVVLVHGAGVRAEIFRPPLPHTLVDALLDEGWDVWLLNWRASIDFDPVSWTLDDAAVLDFPPAVEHILAATGAATCKAIVHCQGSTSFTMAAVAGLLPQVDTVISNAVSLHPVIPAFSRFKIGHLAPLLTHFSPYLSPAWGYRSEGYFSRALRAAVRVSHRECDNTVCRMVSFTYGSGRPALWRHENLDEATHAWISGEFADVPMTFFRQMHLSVEAGHLVTMGAVPGLPASFVAAAPETDARFVFLAGEQNRCFLPESQRRSFEFFQRHRPGRDSLHVLRGYGHLDVFFGRNAWRDTYPLILQELKR
jgi:hypothetical protein